MQKRPPIIAVMGHVDHGKTTLLDHIRKTAYGKLTASKGGEPRPVAGREAGGITQSIGAYEIEVQPKDEPRSRESEANRGIPRQMPRDDFAGKTHKMTFIDTPGHEAFSKMRAHSAKIADIAILIVAADDGVKPQTKNALEYILKEEIPYVVAINKTDKPEADVEKTKNDLAQAGVYLEGFGGNISWHEISAKSGEGVAGLLDLVALATDVEDLTYDPAAPASGVVLTSKTDARRGAVVGVVLTNGTLNTGDFIATVESKGRAKNLSDASGKIVKTATPCASLLILGFETLPSVGETFFAGEEKAVLALITSLPAHESVVFELEAPKDAGYSLPVIVKAGETGSLEAIRDLLQKLSNDLPLHVVDSGVGDIHENDVKLSESTNAVVIGFHVKIDKAAENLARNQKITVLVSDIIYELEKSLRMHAKKVSPKKEFPSIEILGVFGVAKGKERVIGGKVVLGPVKNHESFEIWQGEKMIGVGKILNLQSKRQDIAEAETDREVGLLVESAESIKIGNRLIFPQEE